MYLKMLIVAFWLRLPEQKGKGRSLLWDRSTLRSTPFDLFKDRQPAREKGGYDYQKKEKKKRKKGNII